MITEVAGGTNEARRTQGGGLGGDFNRGSTTALRSVAILFKTLESLEVHVR